MVSVGADNTSPSASASASASSALQIPLLSGSNEYLEYEEASSVGSNTINHEELAGRVADDTEEGIVGVITIASTDSGNDDAPHVSVSASSSSQSPTSLSSPSSLSRLLRCIPQSKRDLGITATLVLLWCTMAAALVYVHMNTNGTTDPRIPHPTALDDKDDPDLSAFPHLNVTTQLAILSHFVYSFRLLDEDHVRDVCAEINAHNNSNNNGITDYLTIFDFDDQLSCHWYFHDRKQGTQVLLVSTSHYTAIVFAGTDDLQTSLTDLDITTHPPSFPPSTYASLLYNSNGSQLDARIRIHSGFNQAVFADGLVENITMQLDQLQQLRKLNEQGLGLDSKEGNYHPQHNRPRGSGGSDCDPSSTNDLYITGHSLGGANAILTALALQATPSVAQQWRWIQSISFGCPPIGNQYWRDFVNNLNNHTNTHHNKKQKKMRSPSSSSSSSSSVVFRPIFRIVLGWDLVPRLPGFLEHVGHTIQLSKLYDYQSSNSSYSDSTSTTATTLWNASTYYHHYGDVSRGYDGVPIGWSATPFLWVPGALASHSSLRYIQTLQGLQSACNTTTTSSSSGTEKNRSCGWIPAFVRISSSNNNSHSNASSVVDDDFFPEPPDDASEYFVIASTASASAADSY